MEHPDPKLARQSKTIVTFATLLTTAITSLILHYTGALVLPAEALGGALSTVVASTVALLLRFRTSAPLLSRSNIDPRGPTSHLLLLSLLMLAGGCGSTFHCAKSYTRDLKPTAPFSDNARCDGEEVFNASGPIPAAFRVRCPEGQTPAFAPDGTVGCEVKP